MHAGELKGYVCVYVVDCVNKTSYIDGDMYPVYYNKEYGDYTIKYRGKDYILVHLDNPEPAYGYGSTLLHWRFDGWEHFIEHVPYHKEETEPPSVSQDVEYEEIVEVNAKEDIMNDFANNDNTKYNSNSEDKESSNIYLSVSEDDLQFDAEGETKIIDVYTNTSWYFDVMPEDWVKTSVNGNKIKIRLDCNYDDDRTDYFTLKAEDQIVRIDISQGFSFRCANCKGSGKCPGNGKNQWGMNPWTGQPEMLHRWNSIEYQMSYNASFNGYFPQYYNIVVNCSECGGSGKCSVCNGSGEVCESLEKQSFVCLAFL